MTTTAIEWNLLLQIPLAAVVVFVVIHFLKNLREVITEYNENIKNLQNKNNEILSNYLTTFMQAIKEQREQNIASLREVTQTIRQLDEQITTRLEAMGAVRSAKRRPMDGIGH